LDGALWVENGESVYQLSKDDGSVVDSFAHPGDHAGGAGIEADGSVWVAESRPRGDLGGASTIYKMTTDGSAITSFSTTYAPYGVGVNSEESVWVGTRAQYLVKYTQSGSVATSFGAEVDPGIGIDSADSIWWNRGENYILSKATESGSVLYEDQTNLPTNTANGVGLTPEGSLWWTDDNDLVVASDDSRNASKWLHPLQGAADPNGIAFDEAGSLWVGDDNNDSIYKMTTDGSQISSFLAPDTLPEGLSFDTAGSLWIAGGSNGSLYKVTTGGSAISSVAAPSQSPWGMGVNSEDSLWTSTQNGNSVYKLNQSGSIITSFGDDTEGITVNADDSLWAYQTYYAESLHLVNEAGTRIDSIGLAGGDPAGVGIDAEDCLWMVETSKQSVYKLGDLGGGASNPELAGAGASIIVGFDAPASGVEGLGVD
jgi:streptogramin lyase